MDNKYKLIYDKMESGQFYTAAQLGVAAASLTAMCKRGLLEKKQTKPLQYRKIDNSKMFTIIEYAKKENAEYFTLFNKDNKLGMMCSVKNGVVVDCWGKLYDLSNVNCMRVYKKGLKAEYWL